MDRRTFLRQMSALGGACALAPGSALQSLASPAEPNWLLGWTSITERELSALDMQVEGDLPAELNGVLLRNGPARFDRGDLRYDHWFDGDGMIQQFTIRDGRISHRGRFIETEKYLLEEDAGRFLFDGAGTVFADAQPGRNNDTQNVANTALQVWGDEVLALWEGGSAYRIDPLTLESRGIQTWREDMKHMPFSAHPLVDRDGTMWNFGFAPYSGGSGLIVVYHIDPVSGVKNVNAIRLPFAGYLHDFAITEHYLAFVIPPYHSKAEHGETFVDRFRWEPELGSRLVLVDKNDLSSQQWFELPEGFVFHFGHASEVGREVRVQLSWHKDPGIMAMGMRQLMRTGLETPVNQAQAATIVANLDTGNARLDVSETVFEFPGFDENSTDPNRVMQGVGETMDAQGRWRESLVMWSPDKGETGRYLFPYGTFGEEPLCVAGKGNDWIVQTCLDCVRGETELNIFNVDGISAGPVARATMPRAVPLGFHGTFMPEA